jgi:hypothetical protein
VAAKHIVRRRRGPAISNGGNPDTRLLREQSGAEMMRRAVAGVSHRELTGLGLRQRDDLGD